MISFLNVLLNSASGYETEIFTYCKTIPHYHLTPRPTPLVVLVLILPVVTVLVVHQPTLVYNFLFS